MSKAAGLNEWFWLKCLLHCLHNSVKAGLDKVMEVTDAVGKVKSFVTLMHKSTKQATIFK